MTPFSSRSVTPAAVLSPPQQVQTVAVGEQLRCDYVVHELPSSSTPPRTASGKSIVYRALLSRIEVLQAENSNLREKAADKK